MAEKLETEEAVLQALSECYRAPAWALLTHVRNGTGYARRTTRTADALAMSLWPSRGLELNGFEVKVSRSDWKRELDDPEKSAEIQGYCDRWWVVVGDAEIVKPGELPPTWGLLVPTRRGLTATVEAPKLEAKPLDRLLLAAILRRVAETRAASASAKEIAAAVEAERERLREIHERDRNGIEQRARDELANLKADVERFEADAGIAIAQWWSARRGRSPGQALRWWLAGGAERSREQLEALRGQAEAALAGINDALSATSAGMEEVSNGN